MKALTQILQVTLAASMMLAMTACMPSNFKPLKASNNALENSDTFVPDKDLPAFTEEDDFLPEDEPVFEEQGEMDPEGEEEEKSAASSIPVPKGTPVEELPVVKVSPTPTPMPTPTPQPTATPSMATVTIKKGDRVVKQEPVKTPVQAEKEKQEPITKSEPAEDKVPTPVSKPEEKTEKTADAADFSGPGVAKPTLYYFATFNEDESKCTQDSMLHGRGATEILKVCKETLEQCGLQGSCAIIQNGNMRAFNVLDRVGGVDHFFEISKSECRFGYGVRQYCLDPFYTLAADLSIYKPGQVIYVPAIRGTQLPDGTKHSGYFVIRDQGRGIKGTGRFDFFSGTFSWRDSRNPFKKLGLGDTKTKVPYFKVSGKTARQVLEHRAFPKLPKK